MRDLGRLADLSHTIERAAVALCREERDDRDIESYLAALTGGEPEAAALALSYVLRRREDEGPRPELDRTVAVLQATLRRCHQPDDAT